MCTRTPLWFSWTVRQSRWLWLAKSWPLGIVDLVEAMFQGKRRATLWVCKTMSAAETWRSSCPNVQTACSLCHGFLNVCVGVRVCLFAWGYPFHFGWLANQNQSQRFAAGPNILPPRYSSLCAMRCHALRAGCVGLRHGQPRSLKGSQPPISFVSAGVVQADPSS